MSQAAHPPCISITLPQEDATERLGMLLARLVRPGDVLALQGAIGAGKTHLARALVRAWLGHADEEVPSPSFTLVQTYGPPDMPDALWHVDLYRLGHPDEVAELGLEDAMGRRICLIEWPERLGSRLPPDALHLRLSAAGEGRVAELSGGRAGLVAEIAAAWAREAAHAG